MRRCSAVAQCGQAGQHRRQFIVDRRQQRGQFGFGYAGFACQFQRGGCRRHAFGADVAGGAAQGMGDPRCRCGVVALPCRFEILPQSGVAVAEAHQHAQVKVLPAHAGRQAGALVDARELRRQGVGGRFVFGIGLPRRGCYSGRLLGADPLTHGGEHGGDV